MKKFILIITSSIIATGLISCSTDNSPQPEPMPKIQNSATLKSGWVQSSLKLCAAGSFVPTLFDNAIFTADNDGYIYKLDPTDGSIINEFHVSRDLSSGTGVSGGVVFVTTKDAYLLAIDKGTGKIRWQAQLPTVSIEAPQATSDIVIVRTNDAEVLAFNINDGTPVWSYQKPIPPLTLRVQNTFQVIGNEVVAIGLPGGKLALLNLHTGTPIWENYIAIPEGATDLDKITDIGMRPVLDNKIMCVASYNGKIACLDAISSNVIWQKKFSTAQGLVIDEQNVYAVSQDGVIYAFDKATGAQIWQNKTMQYRSMSIPALLGNGVLVVDNDGYVHMFNRNDGQEMARISTSLSGGVSYPMVRDNGVVYQSAGGYVALIKNY
ncbi:MAG: outer membrane protein assembly factor BamB [Neisseriales bacterium]|jgi:outer membrane protein assembly factor BamB|nr:MAG: outer membrane protein assembly factor BamB [Neisseriales bacterium]HRG61719.1 outer membrane protein assembly factor BamB [Burkholderiales bacterium]